MRIEKDDIIAASPELGIYLTCELTVEWYEEITINGWSNHWKPLDFFQLFQEVYGLILAHRESPVYAIKRLNERLGLLTTEKAIFVYLKLEQRLEKDLKNVLFSTNEKLKVCYTLIKREIERHFPTNEASKAIEEKFKWSKVKEYLASLPDTNTQLSYLIDISAEYQQHIINTDEISNRIPELCQIEIERIKAQQELELLLAPYSGAVYLSSKKGTKIDFIRIINALYDLRFFVDANDQVPSKETVMSSMGKALGADLSTYDVDLSQALNSGNCEKNIAIFKQMQGVTANQVLNRNVTKKQY